MTEIGFPGVVIALIGGALKVSTPFLFVSLGECITEKSGRVNLGHEGVLVLGAMSGYGVSYLSGSPWLGVLAAGASGMLITAIHGYLARYPSMNEAALGIALMILGLGISFFFGKALVQLQAPRLPAFSLFGQARNPALREAFRVNVLLFIGILLVFTLKWALANTGWGLILRMCGESAQSAHARGYNVNRVRFAATAAGGFLSGIGGSYLSLFYPGAWLEGLSSGQGLMGVALVIFARWNPLYCLYTALLFGAAGSIGVSLQSIGISQGFYLFNTAPAVFAIIIMLTSSRRGSMLSGQPAELSLVH